MTNPTESSFRSYLTELSFRRHLADIHRPVIDDVSHAPGAQNGTVTEKANGELSNGHNATATKHPSGSETPPIAPFRFANHVAISLRTPPLAYRSLLFFALAFTSPVCAPIFVSDSGSKGKGCAVRDPVVVFLGLMGHWIYVGSLPARFQWIARLLLEEIRDRSSKKDPVTRAGIIEMRAVPPKEEVACESRRFI